ncbi:MAG: CRISPR-associated endonuclease Cas2 [Thermoguttaceae bacterium]|nr:CRISPR-associated endonuclease Cas2 [Thermoguttaceae bacterium]
MMVLVAYDVNVESKDGRRRLRRVAKICVNYGQRVQNSVFECLVDPAQLVELKAALFKEIDPQLDSLRYYQLGKNWRDRVEHVGAKPTFDPEGTIVL